MSVITNATARAATYQANIARTGHSGSSSITATNAHQLYQQWDIDDSSTISDQPVVDDDTIFWGDWSGYEHATSLDGTAKWSTWLGQSPEPSSCPYPLPPLGIVSTATTGNLNGRSLVWVGGGSGQMVALDAMTGAVVWQTQLGASPENILWSSPALYNGSIYEGVASFDDCPLVPGALYRLDAATGAVQAVYDVVPPGCLGGGIWSSPAIDSAENAVFVTTGNDNCGSPYQDAIIKLNATTLAMESIWQVPASQQVADGDFGATPMLFTATIGGRTHQMVGGEDKNGIYYALDQDDLAAGPVWQQRVATSAALSDCNDTISPSDWAGGGSPVIVAGVTLSGSTCGGSLTAFDPSTGHTRWQASLPGTVLGAVTDAPGIVAVGSGPCLEVLSSSNGSLLYSYEEPGSGWFYGPPSISGGTLLAGNSDGNLRAFAVDTVAPTTSVLVPSAGASLAGDQWLDAGASDNVGVSRVEFLLSGGSYDQAPIATATPTYYGWLAGWDTTSVPDGTYTLQSVAYDAAGNAGYSAGITVTVDNTPPTTSVLVPSAGASLAGDQWLDAGASDNVGVSRVEFLLSGGSYDQAPIATATPTYYGWLAGWDTTSVPDGTYTLQSVAYDAAGNAGYSAGITVRVDN
jgi:outer membrane protein assembly factor BamB